MSTPARYYSSTALETNLTAAVNTSVTTIQVASTVGFPASTPFTVAVDYNAVNEELMDVTSVVGLSLTVVRSVDSTAASSHNAGAVVRHVSSARDFRESRAHEAATTNVHGFTPASGAFVGTTATQTLSNKTMDHATGTFDNITIYDKGSFATRVIGDSTSPGTDRFQVVNNEVSLSPFFSIKGAGALWVNNPAANGDTSVAIRLVDTDGVTSRFGLLYGGTMRVVPNATTTSPPVDILAADVLSTKRAIRVADASAAAERFTVWNDGHVDIAGQNGAMSLLDVTHTVASPTGAYIRAIDSTGTTLWTVGGNSRMDANFRADIRNNAADGVVFRVFANTTSQTQALQQWIGQAGTTVASVSAAGGGTFATVTSAGAISGTSVSATAGNVTASNFVRGGNIRAGSASTPVPGGDGVSSVNVTFSSTMSTVPRVVATPNSTVDPGPTDPQRRIWWVVDNVTASGFTLRAYRSSASTTNFDWIAMAE